MNIGFDGKRAVLNMTGLGNYSRLVIERIAEEYPRDMLNIYTPKLSDNPRLNNIRQLHNISFHLPPQFAFHGGLWRSFGVTNNLRADGVDIYHGLSNELPLNIRGAHIPSVVTIHDVIYRTMPECYKPIDRKIYDFKYGKSCLNATRIIAVSECTKRDIVRFYGVSENKIDVIYQGCDESFRKKWDTNDLKQLHERLHLPEKYLLQVGTIEKRKNLELTIRALSSIDSDIPLVIIGRDHHGYLDYVTRIAKELGVYSRLKFYKNLPFKDLPGLYQGAEIVLYPSKYEGFGIPVLEGLESERPVIAATGSCLEEAGGDQTVYVNPDNPRELTRAINAILTGEADTERMIKAGKIYATRFDTKNMASKIMDTYEKAISSYSDYQGSKQRP